MSKIFTSEEIEAAGKAALDAAINFELERGMRTVHPEWQDAREYWTRVAVAALNAIGNKEIPDDTLLDFLIEEAVKDRDDANARGFSVNAKRGVANQVTKLEEAKLWRNSPQAQEYYQSR